MKNDVSLYAVLRQIMNELNSQVVEHGERVAYLYLKISEYRKESDSEHREKMMLACYAHDIGAYKTEKFLDVLKFDIDKPLEHCIYGYLFMKYFSPLEKDAEVLLYHHTYFSEREKYQSEYLDEGIFIHLLDRIDIFNMKHEDMDDVLWQVRHGADRNFNPKDVEDFIAANEKYDLLEHLRDKTYRVDVRRFFHELTVCWKMWFECLPMRLISKASKPSFIQLPLSSLPLHWQTDSTWTQIPSGIFVLPLFYMIWAKSKFLPAS